MHFSLANYREIANALIPEWSRRSRSEMVSSKGPGCFIWDSKRDGIQGSGMFYMRDMIPEYLAGEMAVGLQQMIDQADQSQEVVVALIFDDKAIGLRLEKSESNQAKQLVPPIIH